VDLAIIGGTGLDEMPALAGSGIERIETRFGAAETLRARIGGRDVAFVPRHGPGHNVAPHLVNYRAQIAAMKSLGVRRVIGVCAVGSLIEDIAAGSFVVIRDFIDLTRRRVMSFHEESAGPVIHTDFSEPYCPEVSLALLAACSEAGAKCVDGAVYIGVDGPRYETPAEIRAFGLWGGTVVGMTNVPEVILAREAALCYGALGVVTNAAARIGGRPLAHEDVRAAMTEASKLLLEIIEHTVCGLSPDGSCRCRQGAGESI